MTISKRFPKIRVTINDVLVAFTVLFMATLFTARAVAQPTPQQKLTREQLAEKQARFIASKVPLSDDKTARFVETYCDYQKEVWAIGAPPRRDKDKAKSRTEEQVEKDMTARFDRSDKLQKLRRKYYNKYRKFLSPSQIERVYQLEREVLDHFAHHRNKPAHPKRGKRH